MFGTGNMLRRALVLGEHLYIDIRGGTPTFFHIRNNRRCPDNKTLNADQLVHIY